MHFHVSSSFICIILLAMHFILYMQFISPKYACVLNGLPQCFYYLTYTCSKANTCVCDIPVSKLRISFVLLYIK